VPPPPGGEEIGGGAFPDRRNSSVADYRYNFLCISRRGAGSHYYN